MRISNEHLKTYNFSHMKNIIYVIGFFLVSAFATSCYDDYIEDYEETATYFSSQKPLRTIVPRTDNMEIEIGAVLAGLRNDNNEHYVNFVLDTAILDSVPEASGLTLMPGSYYTLGSQSVNYSEITNEPINFDIQKPFLRAIKVVFDTEKFTKDSLSLENNYAIPLRIVETSLDSIIGDGDSLTIESGNITIVVVKCISPYSGTYYSKGSQVELDAIGGTPDESTRLDYAEEDLSKNDNGALKTIDINTVETFRISKTIGGRLHLTVEENGDLGITSTDVSDLTINSASYDHATSTFTYNIDFSRGSRNYNVSEQLILLQAVENELRREEW